MSLKGTPRYKHATREYHRLFKCNNEWQEMKLIDHENILQRLFSYFLFFLLLLLPDQGNVMPTLVSKFHVHYLPVFSFRFHPYATCSNLSLLITSI